MNQVTLSGNLCRDPELRQTVSGSYIGSTAIAVSRGKKNDKGEYESDFFDLKFFDKNADYAGKYLRKGDKVIVSGRIQIRDYVSREGVKGRAVEVLVASIENLTPRDVSDDDAQPVKEAAPAKAKEQAPAESSIEITDDDLPF